jgi:hypothetical protein
MKLFKILAILLLCVPSHAYEVVQISTGAPAGIEQTLLAAVTTQFNAVVKPNPLAANTYNVMIYGKNPNYNAPPAPPSTLQDSLSLGATVYVFGYADGRDNERCQDLSYISGYLVNCSSPSYFQASTATFVWSSATCNTALGFVSNFIYNQSYSTPTVIWGK